MIGFWAIAGGMTLAAVGFVAARLVFPPRVPAHAEPREANLVALRAAWADLECDRAAGLLPANQHEAARADLMRRAQEELDEGPALVARLPSRAAAAAAALLIPLAALALYRQIGSPEAIESARAFASLHGPLTRERLPAFRDSLASHLADNPRDGRAWAILGRIELGLDRYEAAAAAFASAIESSPKVAADPEIWVDYAEATGMAEGRTLTGRASRLIAKALELDPASARALDMAGSLAAERGDRAGAVRNWRLMLDQLDAADPRRGELVGAIARAELLLASGDMTKP